MCVRSRSSTIRPEVCADLLPRDRLAATPSRLVSHPREKGCGKGAERLGEASTVNGPCPGVESEPGR